jgi:hypothetical protein
MITISFVWLILSHMTVIFPIYIGLLNNKRRWLPSIITLVITAIFSSIYHWADQKNYNREDFELFGEKHIVYAQMDFFCSYLSIFLIVFYTINSLKKPKHLDVSLILIVLICALVSYINCSWYSFMLIIILFSLIYLKITKGTKIKDILINIKKNKTLSIFCITSLAISIIMQYYLAIKENGLYYHIYHGFWHFFMFLTSGLSILWNEKMRNTDKEINMCFNV